MMVVPNDKVAAKLDFQYVTHPTPKAVAITTIALAVHTDIPYSSVLLTHSRVGDAAGVSYSNPVLPRTRSSWTPAPRRCCIQSGWSRARNPGRNSAAQPCRNHAGLPPGVKVRRRREACRFHQPTRAPPAAHQASMHPVPCSFTPTESDWYEMESDKPRKLPSKEATRGKNSLCKICLKENAKQHK